MIPRLLTIRCFETKDEGEDEGEDERENEGKEEREDEGEDERENEGEETGVLSGGEDEGEDEREDQGKNEGEDEGNDEGENEGEKTDEIEGEEEEAGGYSGDDSDDDAMKVLKAQWAMTEDPEIAELNHYIAQGDDFGMFRHRLATHLQFKKNCPQDAEKYLKKKRRSLALYNRDQFTTDQWFEAIGEDNIPEPPLYLLAGHIMKKTYPKPMRNRLEGWARYDPAGKDPNNPLRSDKASDYWRRHDPNCEMLSNPHRQWTPPVNPSRLTEPASPLSIRSRPLGSAAVQEHGSPKSPSSRPVPKSNAFEGSLGRPTRVRKQTEKGRLWMEQNSYNKRPASVAGSVDKPQKKRKI